MKTRVFVVKNKEEESNMTYEQSKDLEQLLRTVRKSEQYKKLERFAKKHKWKVELWAVSNGIEIHAIPGLDFQTKQS